MARKIFNKIAAAVAEHTNIEAMKARWVLNRVGTTLKILGKRTHQSQRPVN